MLSARALYSHVLGEEIREKVALERRPEDTHKTRIEGAEVTCFDRLFHIQLYSVRAAVTGKARSPTVDSRVRLTISDKDEAKQSQHDGANKKDLKITY